MTTASERPPRLTRWLIVGAVALASALGGAVAFSALSASSSEGVDPHALHHQIELKTTPISRQALAAEYGIRLNLVGVTASGGLVDLRFTITDADKAKRIFTSENVMPAVIDEDSGTVLEARHAGHHAKVTPLSGASYFVLIGNAGGAVQRGVPVSVLFNGVRIEHVVAQS